MTIKGEIAGDFPGRTVILSNKVFREWKSKGKLSLIEKALETEQTSKEIFGDISSYKNTLREFLPVLRQRIKTIATEVGKLYLGHKVVLIPARMTNHGYNSFNTLKTTTGEVLNQFSARIAIGENSYKGIILDPDDGFAQLHADWDTFLSLFLGEKKLPFTFFCYTGKITETTEGYILDDYKGGWVFDWLEGILNPWRLLYYDHTRDEKYIALPSNRNTFIKPDDLRIIDNDNKYFLSLKKLLEILEKISGLPLV